MASYSDNQFTLKQSGFIKWQTLKLVLPEFTVPFSKANDRITRFLRKKNRIN